MTRERKHDGDSLLMSRQFQLVGSLILVIPISILFGLIAAALVMLPFYLLGFVTPINVEYHLTYQSKLVVYGWLGWRLATFSILLATSCSIGLGIAMAVRLHRTQKTRGMPVALPWMLIGSWIALILILFLMWIFSGWMSI